MTQGMEANARRGLRRVAPSLLVTVVLLGLGLYSQRPLALALAVYVCLCLVPVTLQMWRGRLDLLRLDVLITAGFFLYGFPDAVDLMWLGNVRQLPEGPATVAMVLQIAWLAAFLGGYYGLGGRLRRRGEEALEASKTVLLPPWIPLGIMALGVAMFLAYTASFGGPVAYLMDFSRLQRFGMSEGKGYLSLGFLILCSAWIIHLANSLLAAQQRGQPREITRVLIMHGIGLIPFSLFVFAAGDRRPWLFLVIGLLYVTMKFVRIKPAPLIFGGLALAVLLQLFMYVRDFSTAPTAAKAYVGKHFSLTWLNPTIGELGWPFDTLTHLVRIMPERGYSYGGTYLVGLINVMPLGLFPDRPLVPGLWYAKEFFPARFAAGGSLAFSFVGEAFMNFGVLGPPVVGLLAAVVVLWWERVGRRWRAQALGMAWTGSALLLFMELPRADFASVFKGLLFATVFPIMLAQGIEMLARRRSASDRREAGDQVAL